MRRRTVRLARGVTPHIVVQAIRAHEALQLPEGDPRRDAVLIPHRRPDPPEPEQP